MDDIRTFCANEAHDIDTTTRLYNIRRLHEMHGLSVDPDGKEKKRLTKLERAARKKQRLHEQVEEILRSEGKDLPA